MLPASKDQGGFETESAREHLARVLASPIFRGSPRHSAFLKFVVEKVLAGEGEQIREDQIAERVYGKAVEQSSPTDPNVRLEAARLRSRLRQYYLGEGKAEALRIYLPKGIYVPEFLTAPAPGGSKTPKKPTKPKRPRVRLVLAAAVTVAAGALIWTLGMHRAGSPPVVAATRVPASIAVLPIGGNPLGEALTAALVTEMSQTGFPPWRRRTVILSGDAARPQRRAEAVFRGSLTQDGSTVRVLCSLEHVSSSTVLWNGAFERKLADWPESQRGAMLEDIAYAAASHLNAALTDRMEQEFAVLYPARVKARLIWLEADDLWRRGDETSVRRAIGLLEQAVVLDPNFAWAHASLAHAYVRALEMRIVPDETYRKLAHEKAARARELGPFLPFALAASAHVSLALDWDVRDASATCGAAVSMFPAAYSVRSQCAQVFSLSGRGEAAAALDEKSVRRYERQALPLTELAWVRYRARQFDQARTLAAQALDEEDTYVPARCVQALAEMSLGHVPAALAIVRDGPPDGTGRLDAIAATALALLGDVQGAQAELTKATVRLHQPNQTDLIRPYLALRQGTRAATLIEEGVAQHNQNLLDLLADPQIAGLDHEGLFEQVRAKLRN